MIKKAVILAGGEGTRLRPYTENLPKALIKVAGRELLARLLTQLKSAGVEEVFIVANARHLKRFEAFLKREGFNAVLIPNPEPERENGYSLYLAKEFVKGRFAVVMSDHVYETAFVEEALRRGEGLIVDREGRYVDAQEATKVKCKDGRIEEIGKELKSYDAFDTGFFVLDDGIFTVAERLVKERGKLTMSELAKEARLPCSELSGYFWTDVDTPEDVKRVKKLLISQAVKGTGDGWVSRLLNRKLSTLVSYYLVDYLTPHQATLLTTLIGLLSAPLAYLSPPLGGLLYQLSSALDGVDGEIARAQLRSSRFGAWLDSVLDRLVDFSFLTALALKLNPPVSFLPWVLAALFGSIMVSYSTERFKGAFCQDAYAVIKELKYLPGKRDERVFITMLFTLFNALKELFVFTALLTNLRVLATGYLVWKYKGKE
ncbi:MAG: NTP transferase domain-containing protein [Aquificae bacterium]|nr:NTP transferase domain-containing protein [Aquificota bacterium]